VTVKLDDAGACIAVAATRQEDSWTWEQRQGPFPHVWGGGLIFESGATTDSLGGRWEPHPDSLHLLEQRRRYLRIRLRFLHEEFPKLKATLDGGIGWHGYHWDQKLLGPTPGDGVACLKRMRQIAEDLTAKLATVEKEVLAHPVIVAKTVQDRMLREMEAQQALKRAELRHEIDGINLPAAPAPAVEEALR
jgi:hypothetical protein